MKNAVRFVSKNEFDSLWLNARKNSFIAILDGEKIGSWEEYWSAVSEAFKFPSLPDYMRSDYHTSYDLMTDLSWIDNDEILLIIKNAHDFLSEDSSLRNVIEDDFKNFLLPFWEEEAEKSVVGGKKKLFIVYFVE